MVEVPYLTIYCSIFGIRDTISYSLNIKLGIMTDKVFVKASAMVVEIS